MKIDLEELMKNMGKGIPQGLLEEIDKTAERYATQIAQGKFNMKEFFNDTNKLWDIQGTPAEVRNEKLNEVYGVVDRVNHGMDLEEALEDYRGEMVASTKTPSRPENLLKSLKDYVENHTEDRIEEPRYVTKDIFKHFDMEKEEYNQVETLIDEIDEFRRKYHNKFKDADTFWEMLYDKIRETL